MPNGIRELVVKIDHAIWYYLNTQWHTPFLDTIIPFFRNQYFWIPLYLFLLIFIPFKFGRKGWAWCLAYIIVFALADQTAAHLIKPFFHRLRPCNNPLLAQKIHLLVECGSGYSFPSAHAANHFAMGIFSAITLGRFAKWVWPVAITWALLVSYSQVYVGVHFPVDVTCGGLIGATIGIIIGKLFNRHIGLQIL